MDAGRQDHDRAHDALLDRLLEKPGDPCLRHVQGLGDLVLPEPSLVIEPGHLRKESDVI
ncbi:unannotated protein [freshwater metagenome]|uniref:Unannotated protein n=1 Tax=freshwater metagenome TaxID=449393 RepID=A0A6J7ERB1_9ZZZZ